MISGPQVIQRARSLVGVRFRPQGRDPKTGLDCVGVVLWSFAIPTESVPRNYRLRGDHLRKIEAGLSIWFSKRLPGATRVGDVMLFALTEQQVHLAVNCGTTFIHADASLRRVVESPMARALPLAAAFRSRSVAQPE